MRYSWMVVLVVLVGCTTMDLGPQRTEGLDDEAAPLQTKRIVVTYDGSPSEAYQSVTRILQRQGYAIENSGSESQTLTTDYQEAGEGEGAYSTRISASIVGENPTRVQLQGDYKSPKFAESDIVKNGMNDSIARRAWADLYEVASQVGGEMEFRQ